MARGKKIIKTVWIDLNMADEQKPNLRSRLVGKEYSDSVDPRLYAATPPVEAMTLILIVAATITRDGHRRLVMTDDRSLGDVPLAPVTQPTSGRQLSQHTWNALGSKGGKRTLQTSITQAERHPDFSAW